MLRLIGKLARLTGRERALLAEAGCALAIASLVVAVMPFRRVMALVRPPLPQRAPAPVEEQAVRSIRHAVQAWARKVPWRALCLEQALASHWMLRRRGIVATIHYGVARSSEGLRAHAWVRTLHFDVVGCENAGDFTELAQFPSRPAPAGRG